MLADELSDRLYEAAFIPELWPSVCEDLARHAGAFSASVITLDTQHNYRWVCGPNIQEAMQAFSTNDLRLQNIRPARQLQSQLFSFVRDIDLMTEQEIAEDPIYNAFMRPIGLGWTAGDVIQEPSGHMLIVDLIRETAAGPFETAAIDRMNELKPSLSRAAWLASRLAFREARNTVDALSMVGMPAAVIGDAGLVIEANSQFNDLAPQVSVGAANRLRLGNPETEVLLSACLAALRVTEAPLVQSIPFPAANEGEMPLILNVVPIRKRSRDIFSRASAVLLVTRVGAGGTLDPQVLKGLFDLTPAEARIAWMIGSGGTIDAAADKSGISRETVRSYLKKIMMKTGTRSQAQLVLLLRGLPLG